MNPSTSDEVLSKAEYRCTLVQQQAARWLAAYLYAGAGPGESATDVVYAGHALISENGIVLGETERFHFSTQMIVADFDVQRFIHERLKTGPGLVSAPQRAQATSFDGVDRLAVFRSRPAPAGSCLLPSFMMKRLLKISLHAAFYLKLLKKAERLSRVVFRTKALCPIGISFQTIWLDEPGLENALE